MSLASIRINNKSLTIRKVVLFKKAKPGSTQLIPFRFCNGVFETEAYS